MAGFQNPMALYNTPPQDEMNGFDKYMPRTLRQVAPTEIDPGLMNTTQVMSGQPSQGMPPRPSMQQMPQPVQAPAFDFREMLMNLFRGNPGAGGRGTQFRDEIMRRFELGDARFADIVDRMRDNNRNLTRREIDMRAKMRGQ